MRENGQTPRKLPLPRRSTPQKGQNFSFEISAAEVETAKENEPGFIADYDADGHLVGVEVLWVSKRARSAALDKVA
ncbi:DUF2283 domain-containing protein [Thiorhodococcus minor]|uniref:DUF2283 domain-containing protein n=1 Tax=Thiorhodococcus minor TaxID=57489 RepID=A0A6M0K4I0_9GAMM|nr:DUF2283 domain-containing protein [Thiorhodococcus minor]NEV63803.1 DUF2283 domain-containing protein [Thiorhodococcus minor]